MSIIERDFGCCFGSDASCPGVKHSAPSIKTAGHRANAEIFEEALFLPNSADGCFSDLCGAPRPANGGLMGSHVGCLASSLRCFMKVHKASVAT